jgi:anti-sigma factor RsiW
MDTDHPKPRRPEDVDDDCRAWQFDAASYVLGALSPGDRQSFEEHLGRCAGCRDVLVSLAAMPGLLRRAHPPDAARGGGLGTGHVE